MIRPLHFQHPNIVEQLALVPNAAKDHDLAAHRHGRVAVSWRERPFYLDTDDPMVVGGIKDGDVAEGLSAVGPSAPPNDNDTRVNDAGSVGRPLPGGT